MKRFLIVLSVVGVLGFAGCSAKGSKPHSDPPVAKAPDVWIAAPSPVPYGDYIAYGAGNFVVVGSVDGNTVTSFYSGNAGLSWNEVVGFWENQTNDADGIYYGNNTFVVASDGSSAMETRVSQNGKDWNAGGTISESFVLNRFLFANDKFYATRTSDANNNFWTSSDGASWTSRAGLPGGSTANITSIAYGAEKYVASFGNGKIAVSTNGIDGWDVRDNTNTLTHIVYGSKFVAGEILSSDVFGLCYSDDGETWQSAASSWGQNAPILGIIYAAGYYIVYGHESYAGKMAYSADGITWTDIELPQGTQIIWNVAFGEDTFVAITASMSSGGPPSEILRCNMR